MATEPLKHKDLKDLRGDTIILLQTIQAVRIKKGGAKSVTEIKKSINNLCKGLRKAVGEESEETTKEELRKQIEEELRKQIEEELRKKIKEEQNAIFLHNSSGATPPGFRTPKGRTGENTPCSPRFLLGAQGEYNDSPNRPPNGSKPNGTRKRGRMNRNNDTTHNNSVSPVPPSYTLRAPPSPRSQTSKSIKSAQR